MIINETIKTLDKEILESLAKAAQVPSFAKNKYDPSNAYGEMLAYMGNDFARRIREEVSQAKIDAAIITEKFPLCP